MNSSPFPTSVQDSSKKGRFLRPGRKRSNLNSLVLPKLTERSPHPLPLGCVLDRSELFVDKITFTMDVESKERKAICKRIRKYIHKLVTKQYMPDYCKTNYHNTYKFTVNPTNGESFTFTVSDSPIDGHLESGKRRFERIEFNPSTIGADRMRSFRKTLCRLLGSSVVDRLWTEARVTRIDLAVDIKGLNESLYLYSTSARTSSIFRGTRSVTQYLGGERSRTRVRLYDKTREMAVRGSECESNWHRLEAEMRDLQCSPAELAQTLRNPFSPVHFYSEQFLDDRFSDNQGLEQQFRCSVLERGLVATFCARPLWLKGKQRYLTWLQDSGHRRHLFDPSDAWGGLVSALAVLDGLWDRDDQ